VPTFRDRPATRAASAPRLLNPWLAFTALGAAVVHLALAWAAAGFLSAHPVAAGALCGILTIIGTAELVWGLLVLAIDRAVVPRLARWAALVPVAGWVLLLVGGVLASGAPQAGVPAGGSVTAGLAVPFLPMGIATLFNLFIAGGLSMHLRTGPRMPPPAAGAGRTDVRGAFVLGLVVAPLLVSALVAPALSEAAAWPGQAPNLPVITPGHRSH
jgi:hypothetical protein